MWSVGDIVLVTRGTDMNFFEIIKIENDYMWISNGRVQWRKGFDEVKLICKAKDRHDEKVPYIPFING